MAHKLKLLTDVPKYSNFIDARDKVLETLLLKNGQKTADNLRRLMISVKAEVVRNYPLLNLEYIDPTTIRILQHMDSAIAHYSIPVMQDVSALWRNIRRQSYALSYAGAVQAINNAGIKGVAKKLHSSELDTQTHDKTELGQINDRVHLWFSRLRRDVIDAVETSRALGEDLNQAVDRALSIFPKPQLIKSTRILPRTASYKESDKKKKNPDDPDSDSVDVDHPLELMDEDEWNDLLTDYQEDYIPKWRDPRAGELESAVSVGTDDGYIVYPWQLEQEITEDFVSKVRSGENEAANEKNITDTVWIAVIDKKTDECCLKRNGLTSKEIQANLDSDWAGDECQAIVAPAHFNCRCRNAPATDDLPDIPNGDGIDYEAWMYPE